MKEDSIETRVRTILASEVFGVDFDEITSNSDLTEDLGLDSLDRVELIMDLEEEFKIEIDDGDVDGIKTVANLCAYIEKKRG